MDESSYIIVRHEDTYVMPGPDRIRFIHPGQTLSLVLGSCISTVFIGRGTGYVAAANHIVLARRLEHGFFARRSAREQVDDLTAAFGEHFGATDLRCLHLVGAGKKMADSSFRVDVENIEETGRVLAERGFDVLFDDTRSHYFATYSLGEALLSVFIEDKLAGVHLSYTVDLERLFALETRDAGWLPASALRAGNRGFEALVERGVIVFITGEKGRRGSQRP